MWDRILPARHADEWAQEPSHGAEVTAWVEMLHEGEDIALGCALRVPPAMAVVIDDDDFGRAAAEFQGGAGALPAVELPGEGFENDGTADGVAELIAFWVVAGHWFRLLAEDGPGVRSDVSPRMTLPLRSPATAKLTRGKGAALLAAAAQRRPLRRVKRKR
jgi:hypothetical protein